MFIIDLCFFVIPDSVTSIDWNAFDECLTTVYYTGTADEWSNITIDSENAELTSATRYYYSEGAPTDTEYHYWHYVDGVPTPW